MKKVILYSILVAVLSFALQACSTGSNGENGGSTGGGDDGVCSTFNVPGDYATIQSAVDAAKNCDTVLVSNGTYTENIIIKGKAITLKSVNGEDATTLNAPGSGSVVTVTDNEDIATVTIQGFRISFGYGTAKTPGSSALYGGGVFCDNADVMISKCYISNNTADNGGGVYMEFSKVKISDCLINNNSADYGGGINTSSSDISISDSNVFENTADYGGGIYNFASTEEIESCLVYDNTADYSAGGISSDNSKSVKYSNIQVSGNKAGEFVDGYGYGGGMYIIHSDATELSHCTLSNNEGTFGGGLYISNTDGTVAIDNGLFSDNTADMSGGGISCTGSTLSISSTTITGNTAQSSAGGGGIICYSGCSISLSGSSIYGNSPDETKYCDD